MKVEGHEGSLGSPTEPSDLHSSCALSKSIAANALLHYLRFSLSARREARHRIHMKVEEHEGS
jgi:hypothetical protein